jgi:outer membrane protein assembly factor BamB
MTQPANSAVISQGPSADAGHEQSAGARPGGPRRAWFPIVWLLTLAAVAGAFWFNDIDQGVKNTIAYVATTLAVVGLAPWTVRCSGLGRRARWILAVAPCVLLAAFFLQLLPIEIVNNADIGIVGWRWRWSDPDRRLSAPTAAAATIPWKETPQDYPRFLGRGYWAEVEGLHIDPDWTSRPPRLLWKQPIGAGWSGFAVVGDYAVTQEQRGDEELVVCYEVQTGRPAWTHVNAVRWDPRGSGSLGGVGPRATPTIHDGKVFAHGATGIIDCLDARTGKLLWSHDTLAENSADMVMWGKAPSPLIVDNRVVVSVGGRHSSLVAYDIATGETAWSAGSRRSSYASPVLATLGGVRQILALNEDYLTAHNADDGQVLWEYEWPGSSDTNASCSQPVPVGDDRVFLSKGYGIGAALIEVSRDDQNPWTAATLWSNQSVMRTKMGNVVVRDGFVYGLNDGLLQSIELASGKSRWKKRRTPKFGHGQIILAGDAILMLSELGELILVEASPEKYHELANLQALEGITWNNPAISGGRLLVRNAEEAACYELPIRGAEALAAHDRPVKTTD